MTTQLETAVSPLSLLFAQNARLLIKAGKIALNLQKSASTALGITERCQRHAPPSRKPALQSSCKITLFKLVALRIVVSPTKHMLRPLETALQTLAPRQLSILSSAAIYIYYEDSFKGYMCLLYASQHNQSFPGTFQDVFQSLLKINNPPDFLLSDAPALAPINPCADSSHGSSNDLPALHQRTSASSSSSQNEERRPPPPPTASEQQLSE